jgi:hypothetical protein
MLSNLEPQYKYIARDFDGVDCIPFSAFNHLFTNIQFTNKYPLNIHNILEGQVD